MLLGNLTQTISTCTCSVFYIIKFCSETIKHIGLNSESDPSTDLLGAQSQVQLFIIIIIYVQEIATSRKNIFPNLIHIRSEYQ